MKIQLIGPFISARAAAEYVDDWVREDSQNITLNRESGILTCLEVCRNGVVQYETIDEIRGHPPDYIIKNTRRRQWNAPR